MTTHPYGIAERDAKNNHGTCWVTQVAAFCELTGNAELTAYCRNRFKTVLIPNQEAPTAASRRNCGAPSPTAIRSSIWMPWRSDADADHPADNLWKWETARRARHGQSHGVHVPVHAGQEEMAATAGCHVLRCSGPCGSRACYLPGWRWENRSIWSFGASWTAIPRWKKCSAIGPCASRCCGCEARAGGDRDGPRRRYAPRRIYIGPPPPPPPRLTGTESQFLPLKMPFSMPNRPRGSAALACCSLSSVGKILANARISICVI